MTVVSIGVGGAYHEHRGVRTPVCVQGLKDIGSPDQVVVSLDSVKVSAIQKCVS